MLYSSDRWFFDRICKMDCLQWSNIIWFVYLTLIKRSRISLLKMFGLIFFKSSIRDSISADATLGLLPPITPGRIDPVSWYRFKIFETHPWLTRNWRDMTQGRTPAAAISTIFKRVWFGNGRPFIKTPPSWLTRPWPAKSEYKSNQINFNGHAIRTAQSGYQPIEMDRMHVRAFKLKFARDEKL